MIVLLILTLLVILPAAVAFLANTSLLPRAIMMPMFSVGAPIVFSRREISTQPHSEAHDVRPSERGEFYYYDLVKYLRVIEVLADGRIIAVTRENNRILFWPSDSQFRKARLRERFFYRWRFPHI